jgi:hypothetical protein
VQAEKPPRQRCRQSGKAKARKRFHGLKMPPLSQNVNVEDAAACGSGAIKGG